MLWGRVGGGLVEDAFSGLGSDRVIEGEKDKRSCCDDWNGVDLTPSRDG